MQVSKLLNCGQNQQMIVPEFLHADLCLQFTESWGSFSDKNWYSEIHVPIETELAEFGLWVVQISLVRISAHGVIKFICMALFTVSLCPVQELSLMFWIPFCTSVATLMHRNHTLSG